MDINTSVVLIVFIVAIFGALGYTSALNTRVAISATSSGLEQCPISFSRNKTIWVKDCLEYTKTIKDLEE